MAKRKIWIEWHENREIEHWIEQGTYLVVPPHEETTLARVDAVAGERINFELLYSGVWGQRLDWGELKEERTI